MFFRISAAVALVSSLLISVNAAPVASLDANTLLSNAQQAQKVNAQFATLKSTDACDNGQIACLSNSIAQCVNGTWDTTQDQCLKSQSCFALPNVKEEGIILACTSERSALSVISASGATGGIDGSNDSNDSSSSSSKDRHSMMNAASSTTVDASPSATVDATTSDYTPLPTSVDLPGAESGDDNNNQGSLSGRSSSASASASAASSIITPAPSSTSGSVDVVTVTLTLSPGTTTLAPQTTLLSPQDAAKAISSLLKQEGATLVGGSISPTMTLSASTAVEAAATTTGLSPGGYRYAAYAY